MMQVVQRVAPNLLTLPERPLVGNGEYGFYFATFSREDGDMHLLRYFGHRYPRTRPGTPLLDSSNQALVFHYEDENGKGAWQLMEVGKE
ncbi:hypothetical protein A2886_01390 [candidate division WWE3 bacterium RIFCSPHIGHO2_01_FULL_42_13]|uniref:Uncharacterized protein n=1 Tax=candidate division WWE3 bacterium RIFCSPHIGHO2_01_FULL_42_13 TaxID=1802617 RepID=A0A1F4USG4_UNCKA|nr:MAG: hypothetical protein A2886_01390 [candidate division WWE3 bacterium RIFCSPHIGHO2_01_FULL_42_13]